MEAFFENKTKYTEEAYLKFLEAYNKKYGKKYKRGTMFFIIAMLYFLIMNIIYVRDIKMIIFLTIMLLIAIYARIHVQNKIVEKELNSEKFTGEQVFTFKFYKETINISNEEEEQEIGYYNIYSIQETPEYVYLYLDSRNALILAKDGFNGEDIVGFKKFMANKMKHKFGNKVNYLKTSFKKKNKNKENKND